MGYNTTFATDKDAGASLPSGGCDTVVAATGATAMVRGSVNIVK